MNVDKTWRDHKTRRLDDFFVRSCYELADVCNTIADYPHVSSEGLATGSVDDRSADYDP
jgi:hypothetical protein